MTKLSDFLATHLDIDALTIEKLIEKHKKIKPYKESEPGTEWVAADPFVEYRAKPKPKQMNIAYQDKARIVDFVHNPSTYPRLLEDLLSSTGLTSKFLAEQVFQITPKTFAKYRTEGLPLPARMAELSLKLISLYSLGVEVFSSLESFNRWAHKPEYGVFDMVPVSLYKTVSGIDMVHDALQMIAFGATA